jgi:glutathione S-transferase
VAGFAPPYLIDGDVVLAQMPAICTYLAPRCQLAPEGDAGRARALQLLLTIADVVDEVHDTHHPVGSGLYYEEQKEAAAAAARLFREQRLPRWLAFFERLLDRGGPWLCGESISHADLALFQLVAGLRYAFPIASEPALAEVPRVNGLARRVAERPRLAAYLSSARRIPFNQDGIFRHYPELDA